MGAIGPKRIFGWGQIYNSLTWGFLVGAILPVPVFFLQRRFPNSWLRYIHVPVLFFGPLSSRRTTSRISGRRSVYPGSSTCTFASACSGGGHGTRMC